MAGDQDFFRRLARQKAFTIRQIPTLERGIDANVVFAFVHSDKLIVRETKSPVFLVVRRTIWNPIGVLGNSE